MLLSIHIYGILDARMRGFCSYSHMHLNIEHIETDHLKTMVWYQLGLYIIYISPYLGRKRRIRSNKKQKNRNLHICYPPLSQSVVVVKSFLGIFLVWFPVSICISKLVILSIQTKNENFGPKSPKISILDHAVNCSERGHQNLIS